METILLEKSLTISKSDYHRASERSFNLYLILFCSNIKYTYLLSDTKVYYLTTINVTEQFIIRKGSQQLIKPKAINSYLEKPKRCIIISK